MQRPTWDTQINLAMYGANRLPLRQLSCVCTHTKSKAYLALLGPSVNKCRRWNHWNLITWYLGHPRRRHPRSRTHLILPSSSASLPEQNSIRRRENIVAPRNHVELNTNAFQWCGQCCVCCVRWYILSWSQFKSQTVEQVATGVGSWHHLEVKRQFAARSPEWNPARRTGNRHSWDHASLPADWEHSCSSRSLKTT